MQTSTVNASIKIGNSAGCALETKDKPRSVKLEPIIQRETEKSRIMSRFVVVATAILVLMAVSAHANPALSEESNTPECPVNEFYHLCGTMCEPTCKDPKPNPMFCPGIECTKYTASCRCQKNYVRNDSGNCVLQKEC